MPKQFHTILTQAIREYQLSPAPCDNPNACCGRCYQPPESIGKGRIWIYEDGPYLGMVLVDIELIQPLQTENQFPYKFLSYYETVTGELEIEGKKEKLLPNMLYTNYSPHDDIVMEFAPNAHIKGLRILMEPKLGLKDIADDIFSDVDLGHMMGIRFIPQVLPIMAQIEKCPIDTNTKMSTLYYHCKIRELLSLYASALQSRTEDPVPVRMDDRERIFVLQQYMQSHLNEPIRLDDLAKMAHMSKSKLKYSFKAVTGSTVGEYRDDVRIHTACNLLQQTDQSIASISQALGFATTSSFSRFFRSRMDVAPNTYRMRGKEI